MFGLKKRREAKAAEAARQERIQKLNEMHLVIKPIFERCFNTLAQNPTRVDWPKEYMKTKADLRMIFAKFPSFCEEVGIRPYSLLEGDKISILDGAFDSHIHSASDWYKCQNYFSKFYLEWRKSQVNGYYSELNNLDDFTVALYHGFHNSLTNLKTLAEKLLDLR